MISLLNIFTIINLTLLGAILFFKKDGSLANKILALIIFIPATAFASNYFLYLGLMNQYPFLNFINLNFLWAPLVLWYVKLMLGEEVKINFKQSIHLVPYIAYICSYILLLSQNDVYIQNFLTGVFHGNFPLPLLVFNLVLFLQTLIYLAYSYFKISLSIKKYKEKGLEKNLVSKSVLWVRLFINILIGVNVVVFILSAILPMQDLTYLYIPLLYTIAFYLVIYGAIHNSTLFTATGFENFIIAEKAIKEKYFNSPLTETKLNELHKKLLAHIIESKIYLQPELTIKNLSDEVSFQQHHLSQVINQKFNMNFFDFINSYRVEEAKIKLQNIEQSKLTIEGIGTECGFGSASAFYRAFKKSTGLTPSQYIKQP